MSISCRKPHRGVLDEGRCTDLCGMPHNEFNLMKILFLHGWNSVPGGVKPTFLKDHGHCVINPALNDDDFAAAVATAQAEFDQHQPDVVVGSSRGGAVAMNIESGNVKLVLLCPAWKNWGSAKGVKPGTVILHSRADDVIPFASHADRSARSSLRRATCSTPTASSASSASSPGRRSSSANRG